jgi:hypothetical protein
VYVLQMQHTWVWSCTIMSYDEVGEGPYVRHALQDEDIQAAALEHGPAATATAKAATAKAATAKAAKAKAGQHSGISTFHAGHDAT